MKAFKKFTLIALLVQSALFIIFIILVFAVDDTPFWEPILMVIWGFYFPIGQVVPTITGSTSCAAMIESFWLGIPLGILLYSLVFGAIAAFIKNLKDSSVE